MKRIATSPSQMMRMARARTRATRSSSTKVKYAETTVSIAKKPRTIHAQAPYNGGKSVSDTVTTATTTSAARTRTSHCPWRLGHTVLFRREIFRRDLGVELEPPPVAPRHVEARVAATQLPGIGVQPVRERDVRLCLGRQRLTGTPVLYTAVPWADVLADVATVNLRAEVAAVLLRRRR